MERIAGNDILLKLSSQNELILANCRLGDVATIYGFSDEKIFCFKGRIIDIVSSPGENPVRLLAVLKLFLAPGETDTVLTVSVSTGKWDLKTIQ